ncbi:MAG: hypothetical protein R3C60_01130 [Parvularculaceae bacterium]
MSGCAQYEFDHSWAPAILKAGPAGWALLAFYLLVLAAALFRAVKEAQALHLDKKEVRFWLIVAGVLLALLANRLFDLQSVLTVTGRCAAIHEGWYAGRRGMQEWFVSGVFVLGAFTAVAGALFLRPQSRTDRWAVAGLVALIFFVAARAVSLHAIDHFLRRSIAGLTINGLLEGAALLLILLSASNGVFRSGQGRY